MLLLDIDIIDALIGLGGLAIGGVVVAIVLGKKRNADVAQASARASAVTADAQKIVEDAKRDARDIVREAEAKAKEQASKERERALGEIERERNEIREAEKRVAKREESMDAKFELLDRKADTLERRTQELDQIAKTAEEKRLAAEQLFEQQKQKLLQISGSSESDAKAQLLELLDRELVTEKQTRIEKLETLLVEHADEKAKWTISQAICRLASEYTGETTTSSLTIPNDDIKGKIIGREGRNIRSFERITGVDVIVDDTPGVVVVSCFDSVRREVARRTLERLIEDGRIHPARIEEIHDISGKEVEKEILEAGKKIQFDADVHNIHPKAQHLLGRLKFRSSYGQNVYKHSVEVAHLLGMLAAELKLDPKLGRRCGLMHDIGKAIDHEQEGGHPFVGGEFLKKISERKEVLDSAAGHHDNILTHSSPYVSLAAACDAISASRPGARRESLERYVQRLQSLEAVATSFEGVNEAFAIQAGREIRVFVNHDKVDDAAAAVIARNIAKQIEDELTYPGEIRVTVLRETRCVEYAR